MIDEVPIHLIFVLSLRQFCSIFTKGLRDKLHTSVDSTSLTSNYHREANDLMFFSDKSHGPSIGLGGSIGRVKSKDHFVLTAFGASETDCPGFPRV